MAKLKYSLILLHLSALFISTSCYERWNKCFDFLDSYINLILKKYPGINLPNVRYEELIANENLEFPSTIDLCGPTSPFGAKGCEIPVGIFGNLKESDGGGVQSRLLEELRHFQKATNLAGLGHSTQPIKTPPNIPIIYSPYIVPNLELVPIPAQTNPENVENTENLTSEEDWPTILNMINLINENDEAERTRIPQPGNKRPNIPVNAYYQEMAPIGNLEDFNRPMRMHRFFEPHHPISTEHRIFPRPDREKSIWTSPTQQGGLYEPTTGKFAEKYNEGDETGLYKAFDTHNMKTQQNTLGGMGDQGGIPQLPNSIRTPLFNPSLNHNTGIAGPPALVIYPGEEHKPESDQHQPGGMNLMNPVESRTFDQEFHTVGQIMPQTHQNFQQLPGLPGADQPKGFYPAGRENPLQQEDEIKHKGLNNFQQDMEGLEKIREAKSRRIGDGLNYRPIQSPKFNRDFGERARGLEIIEPGGRRDMTKGGQKVLI